MRNPSRLAVAALGTILLAAGTALVAQRPAPITIAGLGTLSFPVTTTSAAAESSFVRGALLLHLFEYGDAADAFRKAEALDPSMAMAYWGEAMTATHPVWDQQDLEAARAVLGRLGATPDARARRAATARERGYLQALEILYGDGPKARRDTLYAAAMEALSRQYPMDDEARAFHALALLGLGQGVRDVPTYLRAAAIAESVFTKNPQHPGAAHYWIHGMDEPDHAAGALIPARALSKIAPDAGHAQHMTSHIFVALGMWSEVVRANINGIQVVNRARRAAGRPDVTCGHYIFWLEYGELQLGNADTARTLLEGCMAQARPAPTATATDPDNSALGSAVGMWSRYLLDTGEWSGELAGWLPEFGTADPPHATWSFVRGLAAARRGDREGVRGALAEFQAIRDRLVARYQGSTDPGDAEYLKRLAVLDLQLQAELFLPDSATADSGLSLLREAAIMEDAMPVAFGPPEVDQPSHERLGAALLALGRPGEAAQEFTAALRRAPNRATAAQGLARAGAAR